MVDFPLQEHISREPCFVPIFRMRKPRRRPGHLIISGTGRAGTTFLVQYLTAVGFDTGFTLDEALSQPDRVSHGGLEHSLAQTDLPDVIKSPWLVDELPEALHKERLGIRLALVPIRKLEDAAESRRRVYREAASIGKDPLTQPGTIWKTNDPAEQEAQLAIAFYRLMETLGEHLIPVRLLPFPAIARDHQTLFQLLKDELDSHGISETRSRAAFDAVSRPPLIHSFPSDPAP